MSYISGSVLTPKGFTKGYIEIHNQKPPHLFFGTPPTTPTRRGLLIPSFINAHTHIGDTFIRLKNIPLPHDIVKLVAPPNGLKHTLLRTTKSDQIQHGIQQGLTEMQHQGITTFVDFRENGLPGITLLTEQLRMHPLNCLILGRPETHQPTKKELQSILHHADGIALSSIVDWDYDTVVEIAEETHKHHKRFALHASERIREPIENILDLQPDVLVHMNKATIKDLAALAKHNIPIVICPRSNQFFGLTPNIKRMKQTNTTILIGTDNFMLYPPSIIEEITTLQTLSSDTFTLTQLLQIPTYHARQHLLKQPPDEYPDTWLLLHPDSLQIQQILTNVQTTHLQRK